MGEPHWAEIIKTAYSSDRGQVQWLEEVPEDHRDREREWEYDLRKETELSDKEIENGLKFATQTNLITQTGTGIHYELTSKGFDVAHDRELTQQQIQTNKGLVAFTLILVLVGIVGNIPNPDIRWIGNLILLLGLLLLLHYTDLLGVYAE